MDSPELHPAVPPRTSTELTVRGDSGRRLISAAEFQQLADVPAAAEWLANVDNPNTRRAYGSDVGEFMSMLGIRRFSELPGVRRAHVIAWRKMLEEHGRPRDGRGQSNADHPTHRKSRACVLLWPAHHAAFMISETTPPQ